MGAIRKPNPVLLLMAAFSSSKTTLDLGRAQAESDFGPVAHESPLYSFHAFTDYYAKEMGPLLYKKFWTFTRLIDPGELPAIKRLTNRWEEEFAAKNIEATEPLVRPLNLDPGYIDLGKLVLASTKDHGHRIYLGDGIFAEITLSYSQKRWQSLPWTYADYKDIDNQRFFTECRDWLHQRRKCSPVENTG